MQPARCVCRIGEVSFLWSRLRAEVLLVVMESIIDVDYLTALHQGSLLVATASDSEFSTALADSSGFSYLLLPSLTICRLRLPDTRLDT